MEDGDSWAWSRPESSTNLHECTAGAARGLVANIFLLNISPRFFSRFPHAAVACSPFANLKKLFRSERVAVAAEKIVCLIHYLERTMWWTMPSSAVSRSVSEASRRASGEESTSEATDATGLEERDSAEDMILTAKTEWQDPDEKRKLRFEKHTTRDEDFWDLTAWSDPVTETLKQRKKIQCHAGRVELNHEEDRTSAVAGSERGYGCARGEGAPRPHAVLGTTPNGVFSSACRASDVLYLCCPELLCALLLHPGGLDGDSVLLVHRVRRYSEYTGQGASFQFVGPFLGEPVAVAGSPSELQLPERFFLSAQGAPPPPLPQESSPAPDEEQQHVRARGELDSFWAKRFGAKRGVASLLERAVMTRADTMVDEDVGLRVDQFGNVFLDGERKKAGEKPPPGESLFGGKRGSRRRGGPLGRRGSRRRGGPLGKRGSRRRGGPLGKRRGRRRGGPLTSCSAWSLGGRR